MTKIRKFACHLKPGLRVTYVYSKMFNIVQKLQTEFYFSTFSLSVSFVFHIKKCHFLMSQKTAQIAGFSPFFSVLSHGAYRTNAKVYSVIILCIICLTQNAQFSIHFFVGKDQKPCIILDIWVLVVDLYSSYVGVYLDSMYSIINVWYYITTTDFNYKNTLNFLETFTRVGDIIYCILKFLGS